MRTNIATKSALLAALVFAGCETADPTPSSGDDPASGETVAAVTGGTCMQDYWALAGNTQGLNCTANDVRIARATNITDLAGNALSTCATGTTFSFKATFEVDLTAQTRYDIGLYFATDGDGNSDGAYTGTCSGNIITPQNNTANFINHDVAPDTCGDIDATHNPQYVTVTVSNVLCEDSDNDGKLNLPNCTSWRQPGSNQTCDEISDAYPGSPSKCNCDIGFNVPITVLDAAVTKSLQGLACATLTYGVSMTNSGSTTLTLSALDDLAGSDSDTCTTCTGFGSLLSNHGSVSNTTCNTISTIAVGATATCQFDGSFCGSSTHTDKIRASFTDTNGFALTEVSNALTVSVSASVVP